MADPQGSSGILRLKSKDARAAIVQKLAADFNLTPIIAEAFYQQFALYFQEHANVTLSTGEIAYEAVASHEPAGKHIRMTRKVTTLEKISQLARLSKRVVQQYIDLLPEKVRHTGKITEQKDNSLDSNPQSDRLHTSGETQAGNAGERPAQG
ncbi:MAG: hypothetical protein ONB48_17050 [candidate division KSB1 bacterium]|nr:hypothetical protein [candidate division KSB1 bacterium]MDZ7275186.1 hypothetical protein [candidate division KSB1 bacterium]MDZ7287355.1 hypothetical protein [candidate division KSB1 bacterium]MDZ7299469.1 hypothetical protein [candidate division KSB1 bacterium]MDZ7305485.1 hypothetical protein [candidate division KSB1 bacterium]